MLTGAAICAEYTLNRHAQVQAVVQLHSKVLAAELFQAACMLDAYKTFCWNSQAEQQVGLARHQVLTVYHEGNLQLVQIHAHVLKRKQLQPF